MVPPEEIAAIAEESWLASSSHALAEIAAYTGGFGEQLAILEWGCASGAEASGLQFFGIPTELFFYLLGRDGAGYGGFQERV